MKYLSLIQIQESLRVLRKHHPIFASTFLVLKQASAPIGSTIKFQLDAVNHEFLRDHYRVHPKSDFLLRVFRRQGSQKKDWNNPNYASTGLQKLNTSSGRDLFLHKINENKWGFSNNYIFEAKKFLPKNDKLSLFHLAVWIYKYHVWEDITNKEAVIEKFIDEFNINKLEIENLFERDTKTSLEFGDVFMPIKVKWQQILEQFSTPSDVPPEKSGILKYLEVEGVGPVDPLIFEPSQRLNIITGDNGLGKTFLMDISWWALTGNWVGYPAVPFKISQKRKSKIKFLVSSGFDSQPLNAKFSVNSLKWERPKKASSVSGLVIYARVDGSFSIWDPVNRILSGQNQFNLTKSVNFTREEVWDGKTGQIEGLLRDWVRWQERRDKYPIFDTFSRVLKKLSPPDLGPLEIGEPTRVLDEVREIPTLTHGYGNVPILFESAGIKRIATLAYLIVWAWEEHKVQARQSDKKEERQMVILIDEAEAHLHPKWQQKILPALLSISEDLSQELNIQLIVTTHSPLVLASSESIFDALNDKVFHLDLSKTGKISFSQVNFEMRGTVDSWLSSDFFGLKHPGNIERSLLIQQAISMQESDSTTKDDVVKITDKLKVLLSAEDPFWIRWIIYAEQYGIKV